MISFVTSNKKYLARRKERPSKRGRLSPLKPFLDDLAILRVENRIANCLHLTYNEKYPIILDRFNQLSRALIRDYHLVFLHTGPQLLFSALCRKNYIICGKRVIKSVLSACPTCRRYSGRCISQQMAPFYFERLDLEYPFTGIGVDFTGPMKGAPPKGRGIQSTKGCICIFFCFATGATHIEISIRQKSFVLIMRLTSRAENARLLKCLLQTLNRLERSENT